MHFIVICLYLPSCDYAIDCFREYLAKLVDIYSYFSTYSTVILIGDMNVKITDDQVVSQNDYRINEMS